MNRRILTLTATWGLATACSPSFTTDSGVYRVYVPGMVDVTDTGGGLNPHLEQTTVCVDEVRYENGSSSLEDGCWELEAEDNVTVDEPCVELGTGATAVWVVHDRCADTGITSDTVTVELVAVADAAGTVDTWPEDLAVDSLIPAQGSWPTDWLPAGGDPWQLVGGETFELQARLRSDAQGIIAWSSADATAWSEASSGAAASVELSEAGILAVKIGRGAESTIGLTLFGTEVTIARVVGVGPGTAVSMEVVGAPGDDDTWEEGGTAPYGARAVIRDAEGDPIFGAPVRWTITEDELAVTPGPGSMPGADYAQLEDVCAHPRELGGVRSAQVTASWAGLSDSVGMSWQRFASYDDLPDDVRDELEEAVFERPVECDQPGCLGCAGAASPVGIWVGLWAGLVGLLRRRR